ncbi:MAG: tetratricopeptide repeat protein [Bacteroidetes bacterium]|nr:MAG: tetratricopeptide repeat protein [Bacteroidota bacterium]
MTALEQAHHFIEKAQYANFFRLMHKNIDKNNATSAVMFQLKDLEDRFVAGETNRHFAQQLEVFLNAQKEYIKTSLPDEEKKEATIFLTKFVYESKFIGRKKELEDMHAHLQQNLPTVVVNGLGGIGKTTLAREYIKQHEGLYDHIVWLEQTGKPIDAFVDNAILRMELGLTFQNETPAQRFEMMIYKLAKLTGKNLLVLDNYQQDTHEEAYNILADFPFSKHWRVLFTSREQVAGFTAMDLDTLSEEEAMALFRMYCTGKDIDETELKALLQEIGYHTLMTEILAKNYQAHTGLHSIADFADKIRAKAIDDQVLQRMVQTAHSKKEIQLYTYLLRVFMFDALPTEALHLLKQIAVLPTEPLPIVLILRSASEEIEMYRQVLEDLAKKGWISLIDNEAVQMHRLIQLLILQKYEPTYKDCAILHDTIGELLTSDEVIANPLQAKGLVSYGESLLQHIDYQNDFENKAYLQNQIGFLYVTSSDYAKALPLFEQALQIRKKNLGEKHPHTALSLNNIALLYQNQGHYAKALPLYEQALQIRKEVLGEKHPDTAQSLNNIATLYYNQGNNAKALPLYEQALQIWKEVLGEKHPDTIFSLHNIATLYQNQGDYTKALPLYKEVLQIWKEVLGEKHPYIALSLHNIAGVYAKQGDYAQALPLYEQSLQIRKEVLGEKHPDTASSLDNIALLYQNQNNYAKALPLHEQALQIFKEVLGEKHPNTIGSVYNIGTLYFNMQEYDKAKSLVAQAYQIWQEVLGEEHPHTQMAKRNLAYIIQIM